MESVADRPHDPWERNLRELKHYTERVLLAGERPAPSVVVVSAPPPAPTETQFQAPAPEPPASAVTVAAATTQAQPESTCLPSSEILGRRAKVGEVSMDDINRAAVKRVHALTHQNVSETARMLKVDRRTVRHWLGSPRRRPPKGST